MAKHPKRPSLLSGLLWTTVGGLFLLGNLQLVPNVWSLTARWWPILLILLGLGKVLEYFVSKEGVSIRAGEIVGVIFLLLFGSFVTRVQPFVTGVQRNWWPMLREVPIRIGDASVRPGHWIGTSYTYSQEATYPLGGALPLRIENAYGQVAILPGTDGEVRVRLRKTVYEDDEGRAKAIAEEIRVEAGAESVAAPAPAAKPQAEAPPGAQGSVFVVRTNRQGLIPKSYRYNTDLEVYVPRKAAVEVTNSFGEARASGLEGKLRIATSHNPLEVRECTGGVEASNRYAETRIMNVAGGLLVDARGRVGVEDARGTVTVRNEYSPVEVRNVEGEVTVVNVDSTVLVEKSSMAVAIEGQGCQVTARALGGSLKITAGHKRIQVSDVAGPVNLAVRYSTATLKDVRGNVEIESNSDRINLEEIRGTLQVRATGSAVQADVVTGRVDIATSLKDVSISNFEGDCMVTNEYGDVTLSAAKPGPSAWSVKNKNGSIDIFLPEEAAFQIDAVARNGRVRSEFSGLQPQESQAGTASLKGARKSGGPRITAETEYSNIRISPRDGDRRAERDEESRSRPRKTV